MPSASTSVGRSSEAIDAARRSTRVERPLSGTMALLVAERYRGDALAAQGYTVRDRDASLTV